MPDTPPPVVADLALEVRSKNAGPFWVTMEVFMRDTAGYAVVADPGYLDAPSSPASTASRWRPSRCSGSPN